MTSDEIIGVLHRACTQIRLAIAVYEKEVPPEESTIERLTTAMQLCAAVREDIATHGREEDKG